MILTSQCETCIYGILDENNKARINVHCKARGKTYCYGQCIPCDDFTKKKLTTEQEDFVWTIVQF